MRAPATPTVTLTFVGPAHLLPTDQVMRLARDPQPLGAFAVGTWGPAQSQDDPKVPRGDVITAVDRVALTASAVVAVSPNGAPAIPYRQVEVDPGPRRRPLPFVTEGAAGRPRPQYPPPQPRPGRRPAAPRPPDQSPHHHSAARSPLSSPAGRPR